MAVLASVGTDESHQSRESNPRLRLAGELGGVTGRVTLVVPASGAASSARPASRLLSPEIP
jgi:hypothetical protein